MVFKCVKGHVLTVPYGFFEHIVMVGPEISQEIRAKLDKYRGWNGIEGGQPRPEANYMCVECLLDLLVVMEHWKDNDPDLEKLLNKWKIADEERTGS